MMKCGRLTAVVAIAFVAGLTVGLYIDHLDTPLPISSANAAQSSAVAPDVHDRGTDNGESGNKVTDALVNPEAFFSISDVLPAHDNTTSSATGSNEPSGPRTVSPLRIVEKGHKWLELEKSGSKSWNFEHFSNPGLGINSALNISVDDSPLDLYLADEPGGMRMYLWEDGRPVPNLPHTNVKPTMALWGDMLVGDIITIERNAMTLFMRQEQNLSASSATALFSASRGINADIDGGAGIVMHPDHHQDLAVWPNDPVHHVQSGSLQLLAYGQGSGSQANAIIFQIRSGPNAIADRMVIKDGTVNIVATGSITPGSSRESKQDIANLSDQQAEDHISSLRPVSFAYTAEAGQPRLGFIAEEVPEVFGTADRKGVDPTSIIAALTQVVQKQQLQIDQLAGQFQQIEAKLEEFAR